MKYSEIMVRYGELSTKGKNRKTFIMQLAQNVRQALKEFPEIKIHADRDRMHLLLNGADGHLVIPKLAKIFGIQNFSPSIRVEKDVQVLKDSVQAIMKEIYTGEQTFKIVAKRSDHDFELTSNELNQTLGNAVFDIFPEINVQMKKPDIPLRVEIRRDGAYLSYETIKGAGGLPVGTSGKGMLMLSGGIDSPVAGYFAMKRGVEIEAVHFASPPYTSEQALQKAKDLTAKLAPYVGTIQFIEVPFTEIQEEIKKSVPQGYWMTITRRMMLRLTDEIRRIRNGLVILNGESLGQVASQTLQSMVAINEVTNTPIIRPVATMDKLEIIEVAEKIDTFELSIQPFEDCCTIFAPPQPKTRPNLDKVHQYEERLAIDEMIERALAGLKIVGIRVEAAQEQEEEFADLL
ncbi:MULTISPECIES: tRNA uracil 4-sulfurtransferase ThiI [Enterococcus]|uniref:Probable tRNA sulfurtransferase n=1 Tax=Enterococcus thailandicus TaxID=417368 RepID=A0A1L8XJH4_ENTTH|nr:tRNA uracil 4-sulfurtransferase ThiI [Enterococcus thailandicus]ASZ08118.1 tRNA 4-thiouridine(8) synthase ThiI [Enterococcus thailandicus]MDT2752201.1 tRNA 4-thiouridine(8) synthase ThiI [Enterococcus thailandicus]MDT2776694.1 tRNA 4-thiouridine(8) synthase ThiI [Enterococcus thailandicus]MDT2793108.1 tRNA 4-thiouridine(8) synthase ThiI [Enterococcus thailandicus]OJG93398.1 thiamine biosynthesis protein ThiI [Enterococcus thailandicus]